MKEQNKREVFMEDEPLPLEVRVLISLIIIIVICCLISKMTTPTPELTKYELLHNRT